MDLGGSIGSATTRFFTYGGPDDPVRLQSGASLAQVTLAYELYGEVSPERDNVVLVIHALTGSQHAAGWNEMVAGIGDRWTEECCLGWWDAFVGPGRAIDTDRFAVLCVNYLGGCYGSTGPASLDPMTGRHYGSSFPAVTFDDIVDSQVRLLDHLGIDRLHAVVGGSVGGQMCLSLATRYPQRARSSSRSPLVCRQQRCSVSTTSSRRWRFSTTPTSPVVTSTRAIRPTGGWHLPA